MSSRFVTAKRFRTLDSWDRVPVVLTVSVCFALLLSAASVSAQEAAVPPTWSEASHSNDARPDYDRLFAMDRVHELHIRIASADFQAMREDLMAPVPGMPPPAARRRVGFVPNADNPADGFGDVSAAILDLMAASARACEDMAQGDACTIEDVTEGEGICMAAVQGLTCRDPNALVFLRGGPQDLGGAAAPDRPAPRVVAIGSGGPGGVVPFGAQAPNLSPRDPIYVPVTVTYDGRVWSGVGMRFKGNSSLMTARMTGTGKVPFRLDFDRYEDDRPEIRNQRFYGFEKLTFSSNFSDDSMLKEVLATEVFRDRGVPAARAAFYRVFVDTGDGDEYWGLYTMIEDPGDGAMLDAQFADGSGNLYKPDGRGASWVNFDAESFNKKTHEKAADYSDVESAFEALHAVKAVPELWRNNLEASFDVDHFLRWLAVNTAIENWDAYGRMAHNYYLYGDPSDGGRLKWIPWDHNMSFGAGGGFGGGGRIQIGAVAIFGMNGNDDVLHSQAGMAWPLISRILSDEVYAAKYRDELERALGGLFETEAFTRRARELQAMITPYAIGQQGEQRTHTTLTSPGAFMQALDGPRGLLARADARRERIRAVLDADASANAASEELVSEP